MIFFIGWSSIAFASMKSTQMIGNMQTADHLSMHSSNHHFSQYERQQSTMHSTSLSVHADHCKIADDINSSHINCKDCPTHHCQSSFSFLDMGFSVVSIEKSFTGDIPVLNSSYLVQYSKGYKKDLLRPPQA